MLGLGLGLGLDLGLGLGLGLRLRVGVRVRVSEAVARRVGGGGVKRGQLLPEAKGVVAQLRGAAEVAIEVEQVGPTSVELRVQVGGG